LIHSVLIVGSGSAGLVAALTLKRKIPQIAVRIVRSPDIGVIGVGEGTTPNFPRHLFEYLGISIKQFYEIAQPTWKIGVHLLWGPRESFDYGLNLTQLAVQWSDLPLPHGYYCNDEFQGNDLPTALMAQGKVFARQPNGGGPDIQPWHGFHVENRKLVDALELLARRDGIEFIDGKVSGCRRGPHGIAGVVLEDGRFLEADFFVDSSGFRSELLGGALQEPFLSYDRSLFCDRAVVGGWERTTEPILPYTTAETMDAGWAWQIEHEHFVNRGYVFSSQAISDDEARAEFRRKNPKVPESARVVKFRSGRYRRAWVENVVGIGNACGFVEPLEATALMVVCAQCKNLVELLRQSRLSPAERVRDLYNAMSAEAWEEIRDFLALHYRLNTRLDTPFWRHCREDTDLSSLAPLLEFYAENGPTHWAQHLLPNRTTNFGVEGMLVMLVGNRAPYRNPYAVPDTERRVWGQHRAQLAAAARDAMDVKEALAFTRHPAWRWHYSP
jgi:tryptophan halogenase